ncbi:MAG: hypothetical protein ACLSB9_23105 [Hydrogeniiclostridium mannosilyticum]
MVPMISSAFRSSVIQLSTATTWCVLAWYTPEITRLSRVSEKAACTLLR